MYKIVGLNYFSGLFCMSAFLTNRNRGKVVILIYPVKQISKDLYFCFRPLANGERMAKGKVLQWALQFTN